MGYDRGVALDTLDRAAYAVVAVTSNALADVVGTELTFLGWRTLVVLADSTGPMRLTDLAARLRLSNPSASKLVRRLERRGLVTLSPNPEDRRGLLIGVAAEGARIRIAVTQRRREILADALAEPIPPGFEDGLAVVASRLERST
jgi:DNA-binding MarR family transcriptional regulator